LAHTLYRLFSLSLSLELSTWPNFGGSGFPSAMAGWFTRGKRFNFNYDWRLGVCNLERKKKGFRLVQIKGVKSLDDVDGVPIIKGRFLVLYHS